MSNSYYFRRRTIGRAASPPTWACYEQIPYDYSSSSSSGSPSPSDDDHSHDSSDEEEEELNMDLDPPSLPPSSPETTVKVMDKGKAKEEEGKGKQRAVEESKDSRRRRERQRRGERERMYTLRPILTIQRSQGFVWNQDLFVPPYIKDRYVASTSPPNSRCFIPSTSASSTNSALTDYEVEVVEIRVREGELRDIIP